MDTALVFIFLIENILWFSKVASFYDVSYIFQMQSINILLTSNINFLDSSREVPKICHDINLSKNK
jgi:hypothetical protein